MGADSVVSTYVGRNPRAVARSLPASDVRRVASMVRMAWVSSQTSQTSSPNQPKRTQVDPSSGRRSSWGPRSAAISATLGRSPRNSQ